MRKKTDKTINDTASKTTAETPTEHPGVVNLNNDSPEHPGNLDEARAALAKLPILGPALWLFARDAHRKFTFLADMDWRVLPPVVLDQCRLYTKNGIPFAFFTWAAVSDAIDARLRGGHPHIAPHEWKSGDHLWLIDIVSPFEPADHMVTELLQNVLPGQTVNALLPDPQQGGKIAVRTWPPMQPTTKTH